MNASNLAPVDLTFNEEIQSRTAPLYERVKKVIPEIEWAVHAPKIDAINRLKTERNAVILGHKYMTPEI
jgi:quinolinate synthase